MSEEELFDIPGYKGLYAITKTGKVWSYPKQTGKGRFHNGRFISSYLCKTGYLHIVINRKGNTIHRLMAKTFIGDYADNKQVNHINGIKTDNRVENLEWCTPSENQIHALKSGLKDSFKGQNNKKAKLLNKEVVLIKDMILSGVPSFRIASTFKVSPQTICDIKKNRRWSWI